jgi:Bacterial Ig-like domain/L,D-transpeptidase catalytic domain
MGSGERCAGNAMKRGSGVFGLKRPAQQLRVGRSKASASGSASPSGSSPDGSSPDGSSPDGSSPDGSSPNGISPDGVSPTGSTPNGSTPADAPTAVMEPGPEAPGAPAAVAGPEPKAPGAPAAVADAETAPASSGIEPPRSGDEPHAAGSSPHRPSVRLIVLGTAAAAAMTAGVVFAVTNSPSQAGQQGSASRAATSPIRLTGILPASQATGIDGADPIIVTFSGDISPTSPKPTITPSVPGTWSAAGDSLVFTPTVAFQPSTQVTVSVPAGPSGVHAADGGLLTSPATSRFTTSTYSQAGLAVLLAQQGYLPMTWGPERGGLAASDTQGEEDPAVETPQGMAYAPPLGTFNWESGYPATLQAQWSPDQPNVLLTGAVMAFDSEHNLPINGSLTPQFWQALFTAQQRGEQNTNGYTYAVASKGSPETLTIYHNGQMVQQSLANTGIPVSPTVDGTFPVFERLRNQIMQGTNPDGSHYADPVQYVAYFNGGDAVHYFPRGGYGWPQSLGCVELNLSDAAQAWPYLTYGSLVSVVG